MKSKQNTCLGKAHHISAKIIKDVSAQNKDADLDLRPRFDGKCFHGEPLDNSDLSRMQFENSCFEGTSLVNTNFSNTIITDANFSKANLNYAKFHNNVYGRGANFSYANLEKTEFRNSDLLQANLKHANLIGAEFINTKITSDSFGNSILAEKNKKFIEANEIYRTLRVNFETIGDYDSASWAYYKERVCKYKSHGIDQAWQVYGQYYYEKRLLLKIWRYISFWIRNKSWYHWAVGAFQNYLWGFAQKPLRVLSWGLVIILAFTFLYARYQLICYGSDFCNLESGNLSWQHYLLFSIAAFSTSSFPFLIGNGNVAHYLSSIQGILGVTILALFTASLTSKLGGK